MPRSVSVVGVAAEVHIFRRAAEETGGAYGVALSEAHLSELLLSHAAPPPAPPGQSKAELVRMGFPQRSAEDPASSVFVGESPELLPGGYTCPRCKARTAELPCRSAKRDVQAMNSGLGLLGGFGGRGPKADCT
ncbi:transcription factor TFIIH, subunit [Monoraphidium neglectum]|uniref:Transcription factor TFIIH, subunit n=1 Tax=Monoraphidium neglectum TaxID=145388 RepID=A0A0D2KHZ4_9CHLO|nr:transcription factor TFIIH, subunit [Monoraphidium neglectum]KIY95438.1 transcription factor TFIIH, subunit [Monoraphidium neglectum]|eukprot:XP_013894458.1 transcription factor TFIIH, subunit [Monoraphidium neglectum]